MHSTMTTRSALAGLVLAAALPATGLAQGEPQRFEHGEQGALLYDTYCRECHTSQTHWRSPSTVSNRASLLAQVERWRDTLELEWSEQMTAAVVEYLDRLYYRLAE